MHWEPDMQSTTLWASPRKKSATKPGTTKKAPPRRKKEEKEEREDDDEELPVKDTGGLDDIDEEETGDGE